MVKKEWIFFDLDGTLTDSGEGIMNSVKYALKKLGLEIPSKEVLRKFIGPPLDEGFMEFIGMTEEEANEAIEIFREYFSATGIFENEVYSGIKEALSSFKQLGYKLAIATSKPENFANIVLEHFGLDEYFEGVFGSEFDGKRSKKHEVIEYALDSLGLVDNISSVVMIGDRYHDVEGAAKFGMDCIGVLYGFGSREELENAGAISVVEKPEDIVRLFE